MFCKLIITPYKDGVLSMLYDENQKPLEIHYMQKGRASIAGNIYVARVKDVVKHIKGAFLDLGDGLKAYYSLEDKALPVYTKKGSSVNIQQGDELLVQVKKDAVKTKDPSVTSEISLSSVYFVGFLNTTGLHFSGKMNPEEKKRIQGILEENYNDSYGIIVRTNAANVSDHALLEDLKKLLCRLKEIEEKAPFRAAGTCMYRIPPEYLNVITNTSQEGLQEIITDDLTIYQEIQEYLLEKLPDAANKLRLYQDRLLPLYKLYSVETNLDDAFSEKVWLKSGGYLIIQETEALTVVDVNTGKFTAGKSQEESFLKVNIEAAKETARQLRLRNISGIIIIDFINMKTEASVEKLMTEFKAVLREDPIKTNLIDITPLGLVEVTRQRQKGTIREQFRP